MPHTPDPFAVIEPLDSLAPTARCRVSGERRKMFATRVRPVTIERLKALGKAKSKGIGTILDEFAAENSK